MSFAALQRKTDPASAMARGPASGLRIGDAHDSFEQEADRVADRVSSGGNIGGWSISKVDMVRAQRDPTPNPSPSPSPAPKPNNYDEAAKKIAEAFLKTDVGKKLLDAVKADPLVKAGEGFLDTLPGKIIAGAAAAGVVSALAATHTALPAQIPEIPLDMIKPGLTVKITYEGPVDKPTSASITFGYTPKAAEDKNKSKPTRGEKQRAENAVVAADQEKFREGLKSPYQKKLEADDAQHAIDAYYKYRKQPLADFGSKPFLNQPPPSSGPQLQLPQYQPPLHGNHPTLFDKKLELKPMSATDAVKKEDTPVQRKAEEALPLVQDFTSVHEVLNRSGRPLDPAIRRSMETRFGYDFSKVRIHDDQTAAKSAHALGAHAYTVGPHIVFGSAKFAPHTGTGHKLLAHELTHVVQQGRDIAPKPVGIRPAPVQIQRDVDEATQDKDSGSWFSNPVEKVKKFVRRLPGYKLFTIILNKDPLTGEHVDRNATNLLAALLNLVPGGDTVFQRIQESGAIEKAFQWTMQEIDTLGLHWDYFKGLIDQAIDSVSLSDIKDPKAALDRVAGILRPAYDKVKAFALAAADKILELAMEAALALVGGTGILDTFRQIGDTFRKIVKDPIGFLGNLIDALKQGFNQFKDRILEHLKNGVVEWIFGQIATTGIKLPKQFNLSGIVSLILQVLGLTWENVRKKLVGLIGEDAVSFLEGAFDFLMKIAQAKDLSVAWKMILEKADNLVDTMLESVRNWIVENIVTTAIVKVLALLNPAGAIIQAIQAIYKTVNFFIEKAKQIKALVDAIIKSVSNIANGKLTEAANYVEATMARTVPVILGFLADQVGLGGIGKAVSGIIKKIQSKVDGAIDKVLEWVVAKGKGFYEKGKAAVGKVFDWWNQRKDVLVGEEEHSIYIEGTEDAPKVMIASVPGQPWSSYLANKKVTADKKSLLTKTKALAGELEKPLPPSKDDKEKAANIEKKRTMFNEFAANIVALGFSGEDSAPASVIHYGDVRSDDGSATEVTASVLSRKHPPGTVPSDEPPVWKKLGGLVQKKNYVQGHLLNHNLGGEGRRFNLTPINKKANSDHLNKIEKTVKKSVNKDKKVMSYTMKAVYGMHTTKPKRLLKLQEAEKDGTISTKQQKELDEYKAEQNLCTEFKYRAAELTFTGGKWAEVAGGVLYEDKVDNKLEDK
jgi:hypothetical protein